MKFKLRDISELVKDFPKDRKRNEELIAIENRLNGTSGCYHLPPTHPINISFSQGKYTQEVYEEGLKRIE